MTKRKDDQIPITPLRGPLTPFPARTPERDITVEAVHQHTGPGVAVSTSEASGQGTLTVQVYDPAGLVNPTNPVEFYVTVLGSRTLQSPTTKPASGVSGTYTYTFTLDPKHATVVEPVVHMSDGTDVMPGSETFDSDKRANVVNCTVAEAGTDATVYANFDTDTATGTGKAQYSMDGGSTWTAFDVAANKTGNFTVAMLSSGPQTVNVRGLDADGNPGPSVVVQISQYADVTNQAASGPSLTVTPVAYSDHYDVGYSGTGTIQYSLDGAVWANAPASPVTVNRSAPNGADHTIVFKATLNGQTITDGCVIPAIGATDTDTVTPDLTVTPGTATPTTYPFTVSATNPKAGGAAPTIDVTLHGCSAVHNGTTFTDGETFTVASGDTVTVNRSPFNSPVAAVVFVASLAGGGAEVIQRTIPNQDKTSFGPTLHFDVTPGFSSWTVEATWSGDTAESSVDGAAFSACASSPTTFNINRGLNDAGHVVVVRVTKDGQTISDTVTIPPSAGATQGSTAPVDAEYITASSDAALTNERVLTDTSEVTWDKGVAGVIKAVIASALARLGIEQSWSALQHFLSGINVAGSIRSDADPDAVGGYENKSPGTSPVSRRITFGTDGSGWDMRLGSNHAGTVRDTIIIGDSGNVGIGRAVGTHTLEVQGNIYASNDLVAEKDVVDSAGNPFSRVVISPNAPSGTYPNGTLWCQY